MNLCQHSKPFAFQSQSTSFKPQPIYKKPSSYTIKCLSQLLTKKYTDYLLILQIKLKVKIRPEGRFHKLNPYARFHNSYKQESINHKEEN